MKNELTIGIGGAAGDGVASAGNTLAQSMARLGLYVYAYNSYQSVIRGGHSYLRLRISAQKPLNHGNQINGLVALNQDTLNRHLPELLAGGICIYNNDKLKPEKAPPGVQLCPLPIYELAGSTALPVMQNTVAIGALIQLMGLEFQALESVFQNVFAKKPQVVAINVSAAKAGFDYALKHFKPFSEKLYKTNNRLALVTGNELLGMGAAVAGCKFYVAYPMSPASGVLHWMAPHAKELGICVRQVEDEISVINMAIGAAHMGVRSICATSGGGFALMTEALGMAGIIETPVVAINVMRGGPSTGLPTKTEQADLNQAIGASQGDYPRIIMAPISISDCFVSVQEAFNFAEQFQCPVIILSELLLSEGNETVNVEFLEQEIKIERGELITPENSTMGKTYLRYLDTPSGVSPRAIPGTPDHLYVSATDEHDEDGVIISDVYTDPVIRKKMADKRARKMQGILQKISKPSLEGSNEAEVTIIGWGSTWGVIKEAAEQLTQEGIKTNHLHFKYLVPFHVKEVLDILKKSKKTVIVEMNQSGQFARHLSAETGFRAHAHIRKYDGEPYEPKHIINGIKQILSQGKEIVEVLSTEPGWRTPHPPGPGVFTQAARIN
jgi:2-oxoglutarate ferredoxin oxidoreductase subunit alpha